jgi:exonuclease SbcD
LAIENGIFLLGYPNSKTREIKLDSGLEVTKSNEGFAEFKFPNSIELLRVLYTPYANEHRIRVALDIDDEEKELKQILSRKWNELADKYCDNNGVNILVSHHFFVEPGKTAIEDSDDEKPILYVGGAQAIETTLIPSQIQYTALGHLHRNQNVGNESKPVMYSGSPLAYSFAEANQDKSVLIIDLKSNENPQIDKKILQKGKKLLKKRFNDIDEAVSWLRENQNTLVELTIVADEFLSSIDRRRLYSAHSEIFIIPEIKGENLQSDKGNINLEQSREELFKLYFKHKKGLEPNESIINIFRELIS